MPSREVGLTVIAETQEALDAVMIQLERTVWSINMAGQPVRVVARGLVPYAARLFSSVMTQQQASVLVYLTNDLTYEEIGDLLGISASTVQGHVNAVARKLRVRGREAVQQWATIYLDAHGVPRLPRSI